jgi:hypothetical protein
MEQKIVNVTNRNAGWSGYTLPDTGITRNFSPKETKKIPLDELQQLQYAPGGEYLLKHCFIINDKDALSVLNMEDVEPEYFYTEATVRELLETGTLDQLEDCLNFAPDGVIDLVKSVAIATELPDTRKRKMISEKTGLNIDNAIMVNTVMAIEDTVADEEIKTRKAAPITSGEAPSRKAAPVTASKYKVVSK